MLQLHKASASHPFPELLAFGETGEPTLKRSGKLAPNEKESR
jgi:hypothetical protein